MSNDAPVLEDYLRLFDRYGQDLGSIYQIESEDDPHAFLFEQVILLLTRPSPFNFGLPEPFRRSAHRYHRGDAGAIAHFSDFDNRHFMLCDLYDLILLKGGLSQRRKQPERAPL